MSIPMVMFSNGCCQKMDRPEVDVLTGKLSTGAKIYLALTAIDTFVALTALVVGILSILAIIPVPAIAAYTLIAISGAIITAWIAATIYTKGITFKFLKEILPAICENSETDSSISSVKK